MSVRSGLLHCDSARLHLAPIVFRSLEVRLTQPEDDPFDESACLVNGGSCWRTMQG